MAHAPKRKKKVKRRRKVPQDIAERTDREIMETVFGKRVMREVDRTITEHNAKSDTVTT